MRNGGRRRGIVRALVVVAIFVPAVVEVRGDSGPPEEPLLPFSTYLGEFNSSEMLATAVGPDGVVWIAANTASDDFPGAPRSPPSLAGGQDVVVVRIDTATHTVLSTARLNGSQDDHVRALALDDLGNAYITGTTASTEFPLAEGSDAAGRPFVARLLPDGSDFAWVLRFGGSGMDYVSDLCLTADGDPVVVGLEYSPDFPLVSPLDTSLGTTSGAFVTRVRSDGTGLVFSTHLGGSRTEVQACCRAPDGGILMVGGVSGGSKPDDFLSGADLTFGTWLGLPYWEGFLAEIDPSGTEILRLARFGNSASFDCIATATDSIVLAGLSYSGWEHLGAPGEPIPGDRDVLLRLDASTWTPTGAASIFPQGSGLRVHEMALGPDGTAWICGLGWEEPNPLHPGFDLPVPGAVRPRIAGREDAYVAAFESANLNWTFGTYLGGRSGDYALALAVGGNGSCWVVGGTRSLDFPTVHSVLPRPASTSSPDSYVLFAAELRAGDPSRRPAPVATPAATAVDGHAIRVGWSSDDGAAVAFGIDRAEINDGGQVISWSRVALVPGDAREWTDDSVRADRRYRYSIQAVGEGGGSPPSPAVEIATPPTLTFSIHRGRASYADAWPESVSRHDDVLALHGRLARTGSRVGLRELRKKGLRLVGGDLDAGLTILEIQPADKAWRVGPGGILHWRRGRSAFVYRPARGTFALRASVARSSTDVDLPAVTGDQITAFRAIVGDDSGSTVPVWRVIERKRVPGQIVGARTP